MSTSEQPESKSPPREGETHPAFVYAERRDWPGYFRAVRGQPPRETLLAAVDAFGAVDPDAPPLAVDLGCGEGRDTAELLRRGWRVLAIDAHPMALDLLRRREDLPAGLIARADPPDRPVPHLQTRLQTRLQGFEEAEIPPCDLVNASCALPFCPPEHFDALWARIRAAIRPGGIFAGQFFGDRDGWASYPDRTHHTRDEVERLLDGLKPVRFEEEERDGEDAHGVKKHWHVFHIVARRA